MIKDFRFVGPLTRGVSRELAASALVDTSLWRGDHAIRYAVIEGVLYSVEISPGQHTPVIRKDLLYMNLQDYQSLRQLSQDDILRELLKPDLTETIDMSKTIKPNVLLPEKKPEFRVDGAIDHPLVRKAIETVYGKGVWSECDGMRHRQYAVIDGVLRDRIQHTYVERTDRLRQNEVIAFLQQHAGLSEDFGKEPTRTLDAAIKELEEEFQVKLQVMDEEVVIGQTFDWIGDSYRLILSDEEGKAVVLNEKTHKILPARFDVKNGTVLKSSIRAVLKAYV